MMQEVPDVDVFEVDLMKDSHGLGITIAGYVGGDNTPGQSSFCVLFMFFVFVYMSHQPFQNR